MRSLRFFILYFALGIVIRVARGEDVPPNVDGLYTLCAEVAGYTGETLELKNGNFRYWFYSDVHVIGKKEIKYPLTGKFKIDGKSLILEHADIHSQTRTIDELNGVKVLWRDDGLELWKTEKRVHQYAVLIRVADEYDEKKYQDPSIRSIYTPEMLAIEEKSYTERFSNQPEPLRSIFRAKTQRDDGDGKKFRAEILRIRASQRDEALKQLVALVDVRIRYAPNPEALLHELLRDDYSDEALRSIVDAMSMAKNKNALQTLLFQFLSKTGIDEVDLSVKDAGVRVWLKRKAGGIDFRSESIENSPNAPKEYDWSDRLPQIIPTCEKWCREQLAKRTAPK